MDPDSNRQNTADQGIYEADPGLDGARSLPRLCVSPLCFLSRDSELVSTTLSQGHLHTLTSFFTPISIFVVSFFGMHFKTIILAGLSSLAAISALPSGSHDAHVMPRHHRHIRARNVDPAPSKVKRCPGANTSAEPDEVNPTGAYGANAAKPTTTKEPSSTVSASEPAETETETGSESSTAEPSLPSGGTGGIAINDKLLALFPGGTSAKGSKWSTNPVCLFIFYDDSSLIIFISQAFSNSIALSDEALRATKMIARLSHPVVEKEG
ncbi:hypothetical protein RHS01_08735 [Rhizoctonia solani]|uniref:Uncharacterized protein n=1 Tax=Rhizoctonia solani TaxID=456999 RepID=A0A8H7I5G9_9AGAM|nr:hypothetical protein RHS01_08735 [Rhizoctonia solani]